MNFWKTLKKPIIGLSPMDGVTDCAFRQITDTYGHPDLLFTEFVNVEGFERGSIRLLRGFSHHKTKTVTIAQLFGHEPDAFYKAAFIAGEMGFDGIDINMGCPDKHIVNKGGGAALILKPELAKAIIIIVRKAIEDWGEGKTITNSNVPQSIIDGINDYRERAQIKIVRRLLPVSVKTRIGFDKPITKQWINELIKAKPDAITIHGRTLKQLYSGLSDWNEINKASQLCRDAGIACLGNGDIKTVKEGYQKIKEYGLSGVLLGRIALGNPWVFSDYTPSLNERFKIMKEHAKLFLSYRPDLDIVPMRKHFTWYCKGFGHSSVLRNRLMKVASYEELESVLDNFGRI